MSADQAEEGALRRAVLERVRRCMDNLVGGSGHLGAYVLQRDSFEITWVEPLEGGQRRFHFRVIGSLLSEFACAEAVEDGPAEPDPWAPGPEQLEGSLVLDEDLGIALDGDGRVQLRPWRTLDPQFWLHPQTG